MWDWKAFSKIHFIDGDVSPAMPLWWFCFFQDGHIKRHWGRPLTYSKDVLFSWYFYVLQQGKSNTSIIRMIIYGMSSGHRTFPAFHFCHPLVPGLVKNGPGTSEVKRIASASQFGELCEDSSEHVILHYRGFPIETAWSRGEETFAGHSVAPGGRKKRVCFTFHIGKQNGSNQKTAKKGNRQAQGGQCSKLRVLMF